MPLEGDVAFKRPGRPRQRAYAKRPQAPPFVVPRLWVEGLGLLGKGARLDVCAVVGRRGRILQKRPVKNEAPGIPAPVYCIMSVQRVLMRGLIRAATLLHAEGVLRGLVGCSGRFQTMALLELFKRGPGLLPHLSIDGEMRMLLPIQCCLYRFYPRTPARLPGASRRGL